MDHNSVTPERPRSQTSKLIVALGWSLGLFTALNLLAELFRPGFDANFIWISLGVPPAWERLLLGAFALTLLWSLARPARHPVRHVVTQALILFLAWSAALAVARFCGEIAHGDIRSALPIPFDALVFAALLSQAWRVRRQANPQWQPGAAAPHVSKRLVSVALRMAVIYGLFILLQTFLFGAVTHLQPSDCAVVMGAGVREDGRPSRQLVDRVRAGCRLYRAGVSRNLIFTGGPGEPEVMLEIARTHGVAPEDCLLDPDGLSTFDSVRSVRRIMTGRGWKSAVVVTHNYHLSRTRLAFHRGGIPVRTATAERQWVPQQPYQLGRESAAWLFYYFRPLWEPLPLSM